MLITNMFIISAHDLWFQTQSSICMILRSYQGKPETEKQKRFGTVYIRESHEEKRKRLYLGTASLL